MDIDRRAFIASLGGTAVVSMMDHEAKAEAMEHWMEERLDEAVAQNAGTQQKFPSVAELDAAIETRTYRRGVGNLFVRADAAAT
jgi:phage terminase large subunit GpA-like protein